MNAPYATPVPPVPDKQKAITVRTWRLCGALTWLVALIAAVALISYSDNPIHQCAICAMASAYVLIFYVLAQCQHNAK